MLVNGAAPILAPIIGGAIITVYNVARCFHRSWSNKCIHVNLSYFLYCVKHYLLKKEKRVVCQGLWRRTEKLLKDRLFMGYALSQGLVTAAMFAYISGSPFVLQNIYGASPQQFSLFFCD